MNRLKALYQHIKTHWEAWTATALTTALAALEMFSDYLPLIAGAVGGWPLVLIVSVLSFGLAHLRQKAKAKVDKGE